MEDFFKSVLNRTLTENNINDRFFGFPEKFGIAQLVAREDLVLSGTSLFHYYMNHIDPDLNCEEYFMAGQEVLCNQSVSLVDGDITSLLKLWAKGLSLLELFSGLATQTRKFVKACHGSQTRVLDHCQPVPGYGPFYKKAMKDGGAIECPLSMKNDFIMDRKHIYLAGGLKQAVINFRNRSNSSIIVEVKNTEEIKTACELGVKHIRFKSENSGAIKEGLDFVPGDVKTEIYGHIRLEEIPEIIDLGVNFINLEFLTHFFSPVNFELVFEGEQTGPHFS